MKHDSHVEAYKRQLANQILDKAIYHSNDDFAVFVNYSAQVDGITVDIHKYGWSENSKPDYHKTVYLPWDDSIDGLKEMLEEIDSHIEVA